MKLVLVEDEVALGRSLKAGFESEGFGVDLFHDGVAGLRAVEEKPCIYEAMLLDLTLPGINGDDVCARMREQGVVIPILVLTAHERVEEKIRLFGLGADDYVTKPFSFEELLARVHALVRRPRQIVPEVLTFRDVSLCEARREVRRGEQIVPLTATEFNLLWFLVRNAGRVVERHEFSKNGLCADGYESNALNVHMRNIRNKLGDGYGRGIIRTVHGVGYTVS